MDSFKALLDKGISFMVEHITTRQAHIEECTKAFEEVKNVLGQTQDELTKVKQTLMELSTVSLGDNSGDINEIKKKTKILQTDIQNHQFRNLSEVFVQLKQTKDESYTLREIGEILSTKGGKSKDIDLITVILDRIQEELRHIIGSDIPLIEQSRDGINGSLLDILIKAQGNYMEGQYITKCLDELKDNLKKRSLTTEQFKLVQEIQGLRLNNLSNKLDFLPDEDIEM
jgi:hypothetical protein